MLTTRGSSEPELSPVDPSAFPVDECRVLFGPRGTGKSALLQMLRGGELPLEQAVGGAPGEPRLERVGVLHVADLPGPDPMADSAERDVHATAALDFLRRCSRNVSCAYLCLRSDDPSFLAADVEHLAGPLLRTLRNRTELVLVLTQADTERQELRAKALAAVLKDRLQIRSFVITGEDRVGALAEHLFLPASKVLETASLPAKVQAEAVPEDFGRVRASRFPVSECTVLFGLAGSGKTSVIRLLQGHRPVRNTGGVDTLDPNLYAATLSGTVVHLLDTPAIPEMPSGSEHKLDPTVQFLRKACIRVSRVLFCVPGSQRVRPELEQAIAAVRSLFKDRAEFALLVTRLDSLEDEHNARGLAKKLIQAFEPDTIVGCGRGRTARLEKVLLRAPKRSSPATDLPSGAPNAAELEAGIEKLHRAYRSLQAKLAHGKAENIHAGVEEFRREVEELRSAWWMRGSASAPAGGELDAALGELQARVMRKEDCALQLDRLLGIVDGIADEARRAGEDFWAQTAEAATAAAAVAAASVGSAVVSGADAVASSVTSVLATGSSALVTGGSVVGAFGRKLFQDLSSSTSKIFDI